MKSSLYNRLYCVVKFGESAFLGAGKIVNTNDDADMFDSPESALEGVAMWRASLSDVEPNTRVLFDIVFVAVLNVPDPLIEDTNKAFDILGLKDQSQDNRG